MTHFIRTSNIYHVAESSSMEVWDKLPAKNYIIKQDGMTKQFFLEAISDFSHKGKLYGNTERQASRIFNTYMDRTSSTGVALTGEKGSGKTLLGRVLSMKMIDQGFPCLVINTPWTGDNFNKFVQTIDQPCMVLFDEFEKIYSREEQERLLTLLDGVYQGKKLFVLTSNDKYRIDQHMRNRPGRIFYLLNFAGLEETFIREYCLDNLSQDTHINSIVKVASLFDEFNFDMLKALCEEMNRYGETPEQALMMLNAKPENSAKSTFDVVMFYRGVAVINHHKEWTGNPMNDRIQLHFKPNNPDGEVENEDDDVDYDRWHDVVLTTDNLVNVDGKTDSFVFVEPKNDVRVILTRRRYTKFDMSKMVF